MPADSSDWSTPPSFSTAHTGYLKDDLERLLADLEEAALRHQPLAPIIEGHPLSEISFGYDKAEVDAFLVHLRDGSSAVGSAGVAPPIVPVETTPVAPEQSSHERTASRLLKELDDVRFRMAPRSASGYAVGSVDTFIDDLGVHARNGDDMSDSIRTTRFPIARRGADGYDVGDVDSFLDLLELTVRNDVENVVTEVIINRPGLVHRGVVTTRSVSVPLADSSNWSKLGILLAAAAIPAVLAVVVLVFIL